jgi:hypothetical protein
MRARPCCTAPAPAGGARLLGGSRRAVAFRGALFSCRFLGLLRMPFFLPRARLSNPAVFEEKRIEKRGSCLRGACARGARAGASGSRHARQRTPSQRREQPVRFALSFASRPQLIWPGPILPVCFRGMGLSGVDSADSWGRAHTSMPPSSLLIPWSPHPHDTARLAPIGLICAEPLEKQSPTALSNVCARATARLSQILYSQLLPLLNRRLFLTQRRRPPRATGRMSGPRAAPCVECWVS